MHYSYDFSVLTFGNAGSIISKTGILGRRLDMASQVVCHKCGYLLSLGHAVVRILLYKSHHVAEEVVYHCECMADCLCVEEIN